MRRENTLDKRSKGIIFYTDNSIDPTIARAAQDSLFSSKLPIWSSSLAPIPFQENVVLEGKRGYITMIRQIVSCLERAQTDYVFFCEHDVLYHARHFYFDPVRDDTFYYNLNNWRWEYPKDKLIKYDGLTSLSQLCVNRQFALEHFRRRLEAIQRLGEGVFSSNEPDKAREWGYEPGLKKTRNGGFSDELSETWTSRHPNIDIRHEKTFSPPKTRLDQFKHAPTGWKEAKLNDIDGWNLREVFNIWN